jgi:competence protein ComEC
VKNRSGIVSLSLPFAAGVTAAALAAEPFAGALVCSVAAALLLFLCATSKGSCATALRILFFFLGAFCWCNCALSPPPPIPRLPWGDSLGVLLDRIPFHGEHSGAIIRALLTGQRSSLPRSTVLAFRKSGASHILALSGLHLGIIYGCLKKLSAAAGNSSTARWIRSTVIIAICGIYASATGASPSIVRAFLFICINEAGRAMSGRRHSPLGTFCLALTIQLAVRPSLIASAGFQLSYLAMLGITLLYPRLEAWYPEGPRRDPLRSIWKSVALSVSCQLFTAPLAWYHFHSFPLYFLITNLIALPLAEAVIIASVSAAVLEAIYGCPPQLAFACGELVQMLEFCLETIASLSPSS